MTPFERKIVHDAVAGVSGVHSERGCRAVSPRGRAGRLSGLHLCSSERHSDRGSRRDVSRET